MNQIKEDGYKMLLTEERLISEGEETVQEVSNVTLQEKTRRGGKQ